MTPPLEPKFKEHNMLLRGNKIITAPVENPSRVSQLPITNNTEEVRLQEFPIPSQNSPVQEVSQAKNSRTGITSLSNITNSLTVKLPLWGLIVKLPILSLIVRVKLPRERLKETLDRIASLAVSSPLESSQLLSPTAEALASTTLTTMTIPLFNPYQAEGDTNVVGFPDDGSCDTPVLGCLSTQEIGTGKQLHASLNTLDISYTCMNSQQVTNTRQSTIPLTDVPENLRPKRKSISKVDDYSNSNTQQIMSLRQRAPQILNGGTRRKRITRGSHFPPGKKRKLDTVNTSRKHFDTSQPFLPVMIEGITKPFPVSTRTSTQPLNMQHETENRHLADDIEEKLGKGCEEVLYQNSNVPLKGNPEKNFDPDLDLNQEPYYQEDIEEASEEETRLSGFSRGSPKEKSEKNLSENFKDVIVIDLDDDDTIPEDFEENIEQNSESKFDLDVTIYIQEAPYQPVHFGSPLPMAGVFENAKTFFAAFAEHASLPMDSLHILTCSIPFSDDAMFVIMKDWDDEKWQSFLACARRKLPFDDHGEIVGHHEFWVGIGDATSDQELYSRLCRRQ